ncbi:MAG: MBL fold metallo-hydrolase [Flavisolibacter sp.]|nr:MBL fold metallo-hydrolase [Flavisolibacter sp.]
MQIQMLDMGQNKFGDCILITRKDRRILIDGAHPRDGDSIREQLSTLLKQEPPFEVDLMIVTHCHSDHIGCLPELVTFGDLQPKIALVADERLGFGRASDGRGPTDDTNLSQPQKNLLLALQEESHTDLQGQDLINFLQDVVTLENNYKNMLSFLTKNNVEVIRYGRDNEAKIKAIEKEFEDFGLKILGPTEQHLLLCAQKISEASTGNESDFADLASDADWETIAQVYKTIATDRPGIGAAKNDQSIVVKLEADNWKALLAGDMQFAKPEVPGLKGIMQDLVDQINGEGPYDFIKLTHHSSYNGLDEDILNEWIEHTKLYAHTGGSNDPTHPEKGVLQLLKSKSRSLKFARTDRNGIITIKKDGGEVQLFPEKGRLNDFTPNQARDTGEAAAPATLEGQLIPSTAQQLPISPQVIKEETNGGVVEVTAKIPHVSTRVIVTIDIAPEKKKPELIAGSEQPMRVPDGTKKFDRILFITCTKRLSKNIGSAEAEQIINQIKSSAGSYFLDLPEIQRAEEAYPLIREKLTTTNPKGVLIIGGYDVVPAQQLDAIDRNLRAQIESGSFAGYDADNFIVWSDDIYGDSDGDTVAEFPVSRLPDGRLAGLITEALSAPPFQKASRFGVRNKQRPFANQVFESIPGSPADIFVSERFGPSDVKADSAKGAVYYMLHGSYQDGTRFWGETSGGDTCEAFIVENVPKMAKGSVVFSGCCWGALTALPIASRKVSGADFKPRTVEESIALSYLKAGAVAFVGCTGSHYSPVVPPYNYFGEPMHRHFWAAIASGKSPAEALFEAKKQYARELPHGQNDPFTQAIELKILRQYTCLGAGW